MTQVFPDPTSKFITFENLLADTGWGLYYKYLVAIGCFASFAHALQIMSLPLGFPYSTCDTIITTEVIVHLYLYFYIGQALGGLLVNCAVDYYGRKSVALFCLISNFIALFTLAFTHSYLINIIAVLTLGSCLEGLLCGFKIIISEILTPNKRAFYMVICDMAWIIGYFMISFFSMFMVTTNEKDKQGVDIKMGIWRLIFAIPGGLSLFLGCFAALMEESPRHLLHNKKYYVTLILLRQYFTLNTSQYSELLEMKETDVVNIIQDYNLLYSPEMSTFSEQIRKLVLRSTKGIAFILRKGYWKTTIMLIYMNCAVFFGIYNLHIALYQTIGLSFNNLTYNGILDLHIIRPKDGLCTFGVNYQIFENFFILAIAMVLGKIVLLIFIKKPGKYILSTSTFVCSLAILLRSVIHQEKADFFISAFALHFYSIITSLIYIKTIELYPTAVRGIAVGVTRLLGSLLMLVYVCDRSHSEQSLFWLNVTLLLGGSVVSLFLPDRTGKPMVE